MKQIILHAMRAFSTLQLLSLLLISCATISAMDDQNIMSAGMFDVYDSSYDSGDNSYSYDSDGQTTAETSFDSSGFSDSDQSYDEIGKASGFDDSMIEFGSDKHKYGILHKFADKNNNRIVVNFYNDEDQEMSDEEIRNLDKKHQRLMRRLGKMGDVIEGKTTHGKSELHRLLPNNDGVVEYNVVVDGLVNPKNNKIEFNSYIDVLANSQNTNEHNQEICANVRKIKQDLKRYYNVKKVSYDVRKEIE